MNGNWKSEKLCGNTTTAGRSVSSFNKCGYNACLYDDRYVESIRFIKPI